MLHSVNFTTASVATSANITAVILPQVDCFLLLTPPVNCFVSNSIHFSGAVAVQDHFAIAHMAVTASVSVSGLLLFVTAS